MLSDVQRTEATQYVTLQNHKEEHGRRQEYHRPVVTQAQPVDQRHQYKEPEAMRAGIAPEQKHEKDRGHEQGIEGINLGRAAQSPECG